MESPKLKSLSINEERIHILLTAFQEFRQVSVGRRSFIQNFKSAFLYLRRRKVQVGLHSKGS